MWIAGLFPVGHFANGMLAAIVGTPFHWSDVIVVAAWASLALCCGPVLFLGAAHELTANVDVETGNDVRPYPPASHHDQDWREEVRVACSLEASRSRRADLLRALLPRAARPWTGQATRSAVVEPASE
jgi:hypothetical protein